MPGIGSVSCSPRPGTAGTGVTTYPPGSLSPGRPLEPVSGQEVHLVDPDDHFLLDCLTLYVQDGPEPGGRGRFLDFFPPGDEPENGPSVDCKPGSVPPTPFGVDGEDYSSRPSVTAGLERSDPDAAAPPP